MKEYLLGTNEYLEPAFSEGANAFGILLTRLLLMVPGTNPTHPRMGVGIGPKYRYISEDDMGALQSLIQEQIETYLPIEFLDVVKAYLEVKEDSKYLLITIIADDTKYVFDTENSNTPIELTDYVS